MPAFIVSSPEFSFVSFDADLQMHNCEECDPLILPAFQDLKIDFQFNITTDLLTSEQIFVGICNSDCETILDENIQAEAVCKRFEFLQLAQGNPASTWMITDPSTWQTNDDGVPIITIDSEDGLEPEENQMQIPFGIYTEEQLLGLISEITGIEITSLDSFTACCAITNLAMEILDPDGVNHNVVALASYWDLAVAHYPATPMLNFLQYYQYSLVSAGPTFNLCSFATIEVNQLVFEGDPADYGGYYTFNEFWTLISEHTGYSGDAFCASFQSSAQIQGFQLDIYNGMDADSTIMAFSREAVYGNIADGQCFRYCILDKNKNLIGCSNLFKSNDECFTSWLKYSNNENSYGFQYPNDTVFNTIRVPFWISRPEYPKQEKIQTKTNGSWKRLGTRIEKQYACITDYLPEWAHDRLVIALNHDSIQVTNLNSGIVDEEMMQVGAYDPAWDNRLQNVCDAQAEFKIKRQFNGINSNCRSTKANCCDPVELIEWTSVTPEFSELSDHRVQANFDIVGISPQVTEYMLAVIPSAVKRNLLYNGTFQQIATDPVFQTSPTFNGWFSWFERAKINTSGELVYDFASPSIMPEDSTFKGSDIMQCVFLNAGKELDLSIQYQADKHFTGKIQVFRTYKGGGPQLFNDLVLYNDLVVEKNFTAVVDAVFHSVKTKFTPSIDSEYTVRLEWVATSADVDGIRFKKFNMYNALENQNQYLTTTIEASADPSLEFTIENMVDCAGYNYALYGKVNCVWQFINKGNFGYNPECPVIRLQAITGYTLDIITGKYKAALNIETCGGSYMDTLLISKMVIYGTISAGTNPLVAPGNRFYTEITNSMPYPGTDSFYELTGFPAQDPGTLWGYSVALECGMDAGTFSNTVWIKIISI